MENDSSSPQPFPVTQWSLIERIDGSDSADSYEALRKILHLYYPALKSHLIYELRYSRNNAEDLLHDFIRDKVLQQKLLSKADRDKGKFRSFVLKSLDNFVYSQERKKLADKRKPERAGRLVDFLEKERGVVQSPPAFDIFDRVWAEQVIEESLNRFDIWCRAKGREDIRQIFDGRIIGPFMRGESPITYREIVRKFQLKSPTQAYNLLASSKQRFKQILRSVVSEYVGGGIKIDAEISELKKILSKK